MVTQINPKPVNEELEKNILNAALILMVYGLLCWLMNFYFASGYEPEQARMPLEGGMFGPFTVDDPASTYQISVRQRSIALKVWNAVDIDVLDAEKNYLFSFGEEFWHESGYDDGNWDESKKQMNMKVHFEKAGVYFLAVSAESNAAPRYGNGYDISVKRSRGSSLAFKWLGIVSLALGVLCLAYRYREFLTESD